jgi:hypothetical protein
VQPQPQRPRDDEKNRFKNITLSTYPVTLALVATLIAAFGICFFRGYFNPNFIAQGRAAAPICTVLGFARGINPFGEEFVEAYGNGYSVLWPGVNYLLAKLFGFTGYGQIKALMYTLNAIIVIGTAAVAFYIALRNKHSALLALTVSFTYLLVNSTNTSMGEFSYSAGLSCGFLALLIASTKCDKSGCCMALALITLASLFKIYFALLGIVIVFNCAAFLRPRIVIFIVCVWVIATTGLFFALTRAFPFYFDSIYFLQKMNQGWYFPYVMGNLQWFLRRFGFIFIVAFLQLLQYRSLEPEEKRRQKFYAAGSAIVCAYVLFVMLPHWADFGTYLLHIVAPIVLAYAISRGGEFRPEFFHRTGQIAALAMCILVFIDPTFQSDPLQHWKMYGVLWRDDLDSNQGVFIEADEVVQRSTGKKIYVDPALAAVAIKRHLPYIDDGYRGHFVAYINARRNDTFQPSPFLRWLAAPKPRGPKREFPSEILEQADVVICTLGCPEERTHQFVRDLGVLNISFDDSMVVKLYRRREDPTNSK